MNPILLAAVRKMVEAQRNASQSGVTLSPHDLDAFVREETHGQYGIHDARKVLVGMNSDVNVSNMGRAAVQGALFNWGDEALGALPKALGGGKAAEEEMRLRETLFRNEHPVASGVANAGGALATGLLTGGSGEAAGLGSAVLRGVATGATAGAIAGAGSGEDVRDRLYHAGNGAVLGGVTGAVIPAVAGGVKAVLPAARAARRLSNAIERSGGFDAVRAQNAAATAAGRGDVAMLGDLTPDLQRATDFAANNNPNTWVDASNKINARQANMTQRVLGDVRGVVGDPVADDRAADLAASRSAWAKGPNGYGGLRDQGGDFDTSTFAAKLDRPKIREAWRAARMAGDIRQNSPADVLFRKLLALNPGVPQDQLREAADVTASAQAAAQGKSAARPVSFDDMQQFKRYLDGAASSAYTKGNGALGEALKEARDNVRDALTASMPDYARVDAEYASRKGLENALQKGVDEWSTDDTRRFGRIIAQLSPDELNEFRTGMASKLISTLRNPQTNIDTAKRLVLGGDAMQDKLKVVFGDQYPDVMARLQWEEQLAKTRGAVGGSATHLRGADADFDPLDAIHIFSHGPAGAGRALFNMTVGKAAKAINSGTAGQVGDAVLTQGSDAIDDLLAKLQQPSSLFGPTSTGVLPIATGGLFGRQ